MLTERWSRGCSVLGQSGHINEYREGVLINNFNEDKFGQQLKETGTHLLGFGAPFAATSTQKASFHPYGKTGEDLIQASQRHDKDLSSQGQGADMLTRHGRFDQPQDTYCASLNELVYNGDRHHGEPRVGTYLWTGGNTHNRTVPLNTSTMALTTTRKQQWEAESARDAFATTSRAGAMSAALQSAAAPHKQGTLRPQSDGAGSTTGRKAAGEHFHECDKTYRRTGLRGVYYRGNVS